ncbi:hypothetical protein Lal_00013890 [Lupinus albus]|nr:hypothetical protein Lal_00013890 [Lupinus albus]
MLLRGKASEDQLQFNPEIEKSAKSNRKKAKAKKKQGVQLESQPSNVKVTATIACCAIYSDTITGVDM